MLSELGWDPRWQRRWDADVESGEIAPSWSPARITRIDKGGLRVADELGADRLTVAAKTARDNSVGDWVATNDDSGRIERVLERRTAFVRRSPGVSRSQMALQSKAVCANMDVVFVLDGLDAGLNERRLTREIVLAWESGAQPVVVLTKSDLVSAEATAAAIALAQLAAPGCEVVATSSRTDDGVERLTAIAAPQVTIALMGASGAGKSTLVNTLAGRKVQLTAEVRADDRRGRHTTTAGQLVPLANGSLLIDTPGIRAVGMWAVDAGLERAFIDLEPFAQDCKFADCRHDNEPGCGVIAAVDAGKIRQVRHEIFLELANEIDQLEQDLEVRQRELDREANQRSRRKVERRDKI